MVYETDARVQRGLSYAIVDEVDSILIDEARTPLIISGQAEDHTELYVRMNALPPLLERQIGEEKADGTGVEKPGDYTLDEKARSVFLTESGHEKAERLLAEWGLIGDGESLYAPQNITLMHHVYAALRAHTLFFRDQHYVVQNGEVIIVDEFTGRLMPGRRWSDGLHQAVEAKEHVKIQAENQTLASITFQNYFRMYAKLAGMTGTADTEAYEFNEIYGLETVVVPTNRPSKRADRQDQIYKSAKERYDAVIRDIRDCCERGQPVLVGTTSIENSELLSHLLKQAGLPHELRGRAGRQGDPGSSRFYLSLEDSLLRIFAGDRVRAIMDRLKMPEGEAIEAGIVTRSIESAQRKVEARNFDIRKQLLEYDDVANDQRKVIYQQRNELLEAQDIHETISAMRHGVLTEVVRADVPAGSIEEQWDVPALEEALRNEWQLDLALQEMVNEADTIEADEVLDAVIAAADEAYEAKVAQVGRESFNGFERSVMLQTLDSRWREHLAALEHLRQGIHLRGYAQKNPKQEYKREAFELFAAMLDAVKQEVTRIVMNVQIQTPEQLDAAAEQYEEQAGHLENVEFRHADFAAEAGAEAPSRVSPVAAAAHAASERASDFAAGQTSVSARDNPYPKVGSGKKYKQCHGRLA
ncbi:hypothetical protein DFQ30_000769 [Apophysomyces sp. BC1015]|nr:hypothetical protein DFQ30_000769 [Apophysomyces sp. BC1015]